MTTIRREAREATSQTNQTRGTTTGGHKSSALQSIADERTTRPELRTVEGLLCICRKQRTKILVLVPPKCSGDVQLSWRSCLHSRTRSTCLGQHQRIMPMVKKSLCT